MTNRRPLKWFLQVSLVVWLPILSLALILLLPRVVYAGGEVTDCSDDADLHAKLAGGGLVTFNCGSDLVTITLTTVDIPGSHISITQTTSISGGGLITLRGNGTARIFLVDGSSLALDGVTIRNGRALVLSSYDEGGGLQIVNGSVVTVTASAFADNQALIVGGAINAEDSLLTVRNSTFYDNRAEFGGAIYTLGPTGKATIVDSDISHNTATDTGGGIRTFESELTLTNSRLFNNRSLIDGSANSGSGAGLGIFGSVVAVTASTLESNQAEFLGGAIYADGSDLTIHNSSLLDNRALFGGALYTSNDSGSGSQTTVLGSAIISNTASDGDGGGIRSFDTELTIANSTLFSNRALEIGGGSVGGDGGAISIGSPGSNVALITNSSIVSNFASINGGGIRTDSGSGSGTIKNTIVANNVAASGPNCSGINLNSAGHNIDGDASCSFGEGSDISNTDPLLGPLADNGGDTLTLEPSPGSPAINAADSAACAAAPVSGHDQRGVLRPQGVGCDIGAVEATASLSLIKSSTNEGGDPLRPTEQVTYTVVVTNTGSLTATNALISDTLPANTTFVPGSIILTPDGAGTPGTAPPTLASGLTIAPSQAVAVAFAVTVDSLLPDGTVITNTAAITSNELSSPATDSVTNIIMGNTLYLPIVLRTASAL